MNPDTTKTTKEDRNGPDWERLLILSKAIGERMPLPGTDAGQLWPEYRRLALSTGFSRRA